MFQFPRFASPRLCIQRVILPKKWVSPFRDLWITVCLPTPQSFSQATTSFIASNCQVTKRARWMPWQLEAMKDVVACDKLWGVGKQTLIQRSLNGETHTFLGVSPTEYIGEVRQTRGTETSKYPEEKKSIEIPLVEAIERGPALKLNCR